MIRDQPVFPHIKLTREEFPRALATRIIEADREEYFGAFLNRTNVRILIDLLNRIFRLRSCAIAIDGSFNVPCTQYYLKRCLAPCVASLCSRDSYLEMVRLVKMFLGNERDLLLAELARRIDRAADGLDFETAAFFRDMLQSIGSYWSNRRYSVWLDDTVDTFELYADDDAVYVIVVSQRGRRVLGEAVYAFAALDDPPRALRDVIEQFYRFHLPREIRVSHDFEGRAELAMKLGERFARTIAIRVANGSNRRITAERAIEMAKARLKLERGKSKLTTRQLIEKISVQFALSKLPKQIEAIDVAHISATGFAAGVSVWENGKDRPDEYEHWLSDQTSELDTLRVFLTDRIVRKSPDLVLVDGGRAQLNAALSTITTRSEPPDVIAAVKPKGKHAMISHFLTPHKGRVEFDPHDDGHRLLQLLRDEAHALANATHRLSRDMMPFYELAAIVPSLSERERQDLLREIGSIRRIASLERSYFEKRFGGMRARAIEADLKRFGKGESLNVRPLIVPIRFVETDGAAEDLIPIVAREM